MITAFIDESCRNRHGENTAVYVLAAVLIADDALDAVRTTMEDLRYGKAPTVHWRLERAQRRAILAQALAGLPVTGLVTVCMHTRTTRTERARRYCLVRLLTELSERGAHRVLFESRAAQDDDDRAVLTGLRRAHRVVPALTSVGQQPRRMPVCGARTCSLGPSPGGWMAKNAAGRCWNRSSPCWKSTTRNRL